MLEALVKQVGLERAKRGRELPRKVPRPLQPRLALRGIELGIGIRARRELAQPGEDERLIVEQRGHALRQLVELLREQRAVDFKLPETPALWRLQFFFDHVHEVRQIRPLHPRDHDPGKCRLQSHFSPDQRFEHWILAFDQI